jgi:hypothetical protein
MVFERVPKPFKGSGVFATYGAGKKSIYMQTHEVRFLSSIIYDNQTKWIHDLKAKL